MPFGEPRLMLGRGRLRGWGCGCQRHAFTLFEQNTVVFPKMHSLAVLQQVRMLGLGAHRVPFGTVS
jgi:hypothetical protein